MFCRYDFLEDYCGIFSFQMWVHIFSLKGMYEVKGNNVFWHVKRNKILNKRIYISTCRHDRKRYNQSFPYPNQCSLQSHCRRELYSPLGPINQPITFPSSSCLASHASPQLSSLLLCCSSFIHYLDYNFIVILFYMLFHFVICVQPFMTNITNIYLFALQNFYLEHVLNSIHDTVLIRDREVISRFNNYKLGMNMLLY